MDITRYFKRKRSESQSDDINFGSEGENNKEISNKESISTNVSAQDSNSDTSEAQVEEKNGEYKQ